MALAQAQKWCRDCEEYTLHERHTFSGGMGCLLTVLTAGLFLPVWLLIGLTQMVSRGWHCQDCGRRR